jgi:hypothetical protein
MYRYVQLQQPVENGFIARDWSSLITSSSTFARVVLTTAMSDAKPKKKSPMVPLITGAISGGIECISVWPMEYIKTQLQLQKNVTGVKPPFTGVIEGLSYTVRTTGFLSLYNGLGVTLVSYPSCAISMPTFLL